MKEEIKAKYEKQVADLHDSVFEDLRKEIIEICNSKKWEFSTMYNLHVRDKDGNELDNTDIHNLVYWYEEHFELFPQSYYSGINKECGGYFKTETNVK